MSPLSKKLKKIISITLVIAILLPSVFFAVPTPAYAALPVIDGAAIFAIGLVGAGIASLVAKEYVEDPLLYAIMKAIIATITASIVNWINSGFQGNPAYVQNLTQLFTEIANNEIGRFISGTDLAFLCSPIRLTIQRSLALDHALPNWFQSSCTLTDVVGNIENFTTGAFEEGGWTGWYSLTTSPQNNAIGGYVISENALINQLAAAVAPENTKLKYADGFFSWESCDTLDDPGGLGTGETCQILTPGKVINEQLNFLLPTGLRQLELADEFNEIVAALITQLLTQILTQAGGLFGATDPGAPGSAGGLSFIDLLEAETSPVLVELQEDVTADIDAAIENEESFAGAVEDAAALSVQLEGLLIGVEACYAEALEDSSLTTTQIAFAEARRAAAADALVDLQILRQQLDVEEISTVPAIIAQLEDIRARLLVATTPAEAEGPIDEFLELQDSGALHTSGEAQFAESQRDQLLAQVQQAQQDLAECGEFPESIPSGTTPPGLPPGSIPPPGISPPGIPVPPGGVTIPLAGPSSLSSSGSVSSSGSGQIIQNLRITSSGGDALRISHNNVTVRNVEILHNGGRGIFVTGDNVTIENVNVVNTGAPSSGQNPSSGWNNIQLNGAPGATIRNVRMTDGSTGIYLVNSPGANVSFIEGYDFRGPFPRGQLIQFDKSGGSVVQDFYNLNTAASWTEDNINLFSSPDMTIRRGLIIGNNSPSGVGVLFERTSPNGLVEDVDTLRMGNGCFSSVGVANTTYNRVRCADNICTSQQGRGAPSSNALMFASWGGSTNTRYIQARYKNSCNGNIAWNRNSMSVADFQEENFTPRGPIHLQFPWE